MNANQNDFSKSIFSSANIIAIYTALSVLLKMRKTLGLEAMLEYAENYLEILAAHNPEMKFAVLKALEFIDVKKIYAEALGEHGR